jgi:hypothetical protein
MPAHVSEVRDTGGTLIQQIVAPAIRITGCIQQ